MSVDAVPVEIVVETTSACPDRARAQAALADALASAKAPKRGGPARTWIVRLSVEDEAKNKKATARILDDEGTTIAEHTLTDRSACAPLARALGAWASLVVDDELARVREAAEHAVPPPAPPKKDAKPLAPVKLAPTDWRSPDDPDYVAPAYGRAWTLEVGLMGYVRDGLASSTGFAGGSAFAAFEVSPGWFLRPSFFYGVSAMNVALDDARRAPASQMAHREDFCRRIPGNYIEHRGLELDVCLGADVGFVSAREQRAFRASVGPAAAFRGEIGSNASLELRLASGYNIARDSLLDEGQLPILFAQAEVGVSWRFR